MAALNYSAAQTELQKNPRTWLVTGAAGFIGSHILSKLLELDQKVVAIDNFMTGKKENLKAIETAAQGKWKLCTFVEGDIRDRKFCSSVFSQHKIEIVSHQAALGSVPRSIDDPLTTHGVNVEGFANVFDAARKAGVKRLVYASSSSVYGDNADDIKTEDRTGKLLSPYAASKMNNENWAEANSNVFDITCVGLRYFNVFGTRQDPEGPYAAVIPRWLAALFKGETCVIYGDGKTSRDFCYVDNVVQANLLAGLQELRTQAFVCNVACGSKTSLTDLYFMLAEAVGNKTKPEYQDFRAGDIRHSCADISKAREVLGYEPAYSISQGIQETVRSFLDRNR